MQYTVQCNILFNVLKLSPDEIKLLICSFLVIGSIIWFIDSIHTTMHLTKMWSLHRQKTLKILHCTGLDLYGLDEKKPYCKVQTHAIIKLLSHCSVLVPWWLYFRNTDWTRQKCVNSLTTMSVLMFTTAFSKCVITPTGCTPGMVIVLYWIVLYYIVLYCYTQHNIPLYHRTQCWTIQTAQLSHFEPCWIFTPIMIKLQLYIFNKNNIDMFTHFPALCALFNLRCSSGEV